MNAVLEKLHITKDEINELPVRQYDGPIHLVRSPEDAEIAAATLQTETILGFDTETRPAFRKGESYLPSVLQLASENDVYVFMLRETGITPALQELLSTKNIVKAGVAIERDISDLQELEDFPEAGFIELADFAKKAEIKNLGLRGMTALLFEFRISKKEQVSNWARKDLTESQLIYAATDAWLGRKIYLRFKKMNLL